MRRRPSRTDAVRPAWTAAPAALAPIALALFGGAAPAAGQTWHFVPSIGVDETITSNVNLQPSGSAKSDLVSVITPRLAIDEQGARTSLHGFVAVPISLYARTGAENNKVYPSANLLGNAELYEKFFQVEGQINASQQFLNPFGAQPATLASATENRYNASSYRVSPYIQGKTAGGIEYKLRDDNTWTTVSGAPIATENAYYNNLTGSAAGPLRTFGWVVEGNWNEVKFTDQRSQISELARARLLWQADPQLRFNVDAGYEDNRFPFVEYQGAIYGGGLEWSPTERMKVVGNYEHRYFGSSYLFSFDNRTPLSAASISVSRNVTSYPQQLLTIPATGSVAALLFFMFASRIPDPVARLAFVRQFIADRGLPDTLSSAIPVYTQQISLQENATANFGIIGARNSVFLSGFWLRQQPITGSGASLPPGFESFNDNTQSGGTLAWTHNLTSLTSLVATVTLTRTIANQPIRETTVKPKTDQGWTQLTLTSTLSPYTTVYAGARYQRSRGYQVPGTETRTGDYEEVAGIAGFNYTFK